MKLPIQVKLIDLNPIQANFTYWKYPKYGELIHF